MRKAIAPTLASLTLAAATGCVATVGVPDAGLYDPPPPDGGSDAGLLIEPGEDLDAGPPPLIDAGEPTVDG